MENPAILIYNPDEGVTASTAAILRFHGFGVTTTSSAEEFSSLVAREHPDVVMVSAYGGNTDGLGLVNQLRSQPMTSGIPVIITSTLALPSIDQIARDLWCGYLEEPFESGALVDTIQDALANPPSSIH
jgi:DNA-binding NtrC family response regulator